MCHHRPIETHNNTNCSDSIYSKKLSSVRGNNQLFFLFSYYVFFWAGERPKERERPLPELRWLRITLHHFLDSIDPVGGPFASFLWSHPCRHVDHIVIVGKAHRGALGGGDGGSSRRRLYTVPEQMKTEFSTVTATSGNDVVLGILINVLRLATICVVVDAVVFSTRLYRYVVAT